MNTEEYIKAIGPDVIRGLTDEEVWMQFIIGVSHFPLEIFEALEARNTSVFEYADVGLKEFKKRFRNQ